MGDHDTTMDERLGEFKKFLYDYRGGNIRSLKWHLQRVLPPLPEEVVIHTVHRVWNAHYQDKGRGAVMVLINSARFAVATDVPHPHINRKRFSRVYGELCHLAYLGRITTSHRGQPMRHLDFLLPSLSTITFRTVKDDKKLLWRQQRRQQRRR